MYIGDLVRFKKSTGLSTRLQRMTGVVVREAYGKPDNQVIDIVWTGPNGSLYPAGIPTWDYVDDLELVITQA